MAHLELYKLHYDRIEIVNKMLSRQLNVANCLDGRKKERVNGDLFQSLQYLFECRVLINFFFWIELKMMESVVSFVIALSSPSQSFIVLHLIRRDATES